jgi:polyphosphate glucokinase
MNVLGIDIGGSAVKGAPVDVVTGKLLGERVRLETPEPLTPPQMSRAVAEIASHFAWKGPIGIGFPGVVLGPRTMTSANLHKSFIGLDAAKIFSKATGCRVTLVNDADAAGIAEMKFGAGKNVKGSVLLLTLGTGVGSALFHDGGLFPNLELGHLPLRGRSAERYVSSAARKRRALDWPTWGAELGAYIRLLEALLWPELIIIGGGASGKSHKYFPYAKTRARMVPAAFHNEAGIVGAALWAAGQEQASKRPSSAKASPRRRIAR